MSDSPIKFPSSESSSEDDLLAHQSFEEDSSSYDWRASDYSPLWSSEKDSEEEEDEEDAAATAADSDFDDSDFDFDSPPPTSTRTMELAASEASMILSL